MTLKKLAGKLLLLTAAALCLLGVYSPAAFADDGPLLEKLTITMSGGTENAALVLLQNEDDSFSESAPKFSPGTYTYELGERTDRSFAFFGAGLKLYFESETAEGAELKVLHHAAGGDTWKNITGAGVKWASAVTPGINSFMLLVSTESATETYSFTLDVTPTLKALSMTSGGGEVHLAPSFAPETYAYSSEISDAVTEMTVEAEGLYADYSIAYNGFDSGRLEIASEVDSINIAVTAGTGENALTKAYSVALRRLTNETVTFATTPEDASVVLYDPQGSRVWPDSAGGKTFSGLFSKGGYSYSVSRSGYVTETGSVSEAGPIIVTLVKADEGLSEVKSEWKNFRNSDFNMAVTSAKTPVSAAGAELLWSRAFGSGWSDAAGLPALVDGGVIVMSGDTIYRLDPETGETLKSAKLCDGFNWGYTPVTCAAGMLFVPLDNGTVQALNARTLESLWVYRDPLAGQSLSPIVYSDGYIYTGFWNGETQYANFVCISATDENTARDDEEKSAVWSRTQKGGFYWAGAVVIGDAVLVGSDNGKNGYDETGSFLYSVNKYTGEVISRLALTGDQRSSIAYSQATGRIYFTTKCGYLYSAAVNAATGAVTELKYADHDAQCTGTPLYYKGRLYFGVGSGISTSGSSGSFICANADTLKKIYSVEMPGYPQCSMLLSTAYESSDGYLYFYSTYNALPGGIAAVKAQANGSSGERIDLYTPENQQYCITSIICDSKGTLYYKNDSGYIFAVGRTEDAGSAAEGVSSEAALIRRIDAAAAGSTVTFTVSDMETGLSDAVFSRLADKTNVTLKIAGPYFYWYFNSESIGNVPDITFWPWVTVSARNEEANSLFAQQKVLSVSFAENFALPARATLMLPRLSAYYESGALANSPGAALYDLTNGAAVSAAERFAYDGSWFAITVTEKRDYLITNNGAAQPSAAQANYDPSERADYGKAEQPRGSSDAPISGDTFQPAGADVNLESYQRMADALRESVENQRLLKSAMEAMDVKYTEDTRTLSAVAVAVMFALAGGASLMTYLILKPKNSSVDLAGEEKT